MSVGALVSPLRAGPKRHQPRLATRRISRVRGVEVQSVDGSREVAEGSFAESASRARSKGHPLQPVQVRKRIADPQRKLDARTQIPTERATRGAYACATRMYPH